MDIKMETDKFKNIRDIIPDLNSISSKQKSISDITLPNVERISKHISNSDNPSDPIISFEQPKYKPPEISDFDREID